MKHLTKMGGGITSGGGHRSDPIDVGSPQENKLVIVFAVNAEGGAGGVHAPVSNGPVADVIGGSSPVADGGVDMSWGEEDTYSPAGNTLQPAA